MKTLLHIAMFMVCMSFAYAAKKPEGKELELIIKQESQYPVNIHYKFFDASNHLNTYASGKFKKMKTNEKQYVYVNRIPTDKEVTIIIDKINVANRTVFNDPCEITLKNSQLKAEISVGFKGNPESHGSFTCKVSAKQDEG